MKEKLVQDLINAVSNFEKEYNNETATQDSIIWILNDMFEALHKIKEEE